VTDEQTNATGNAASVWRSCNRLCPKDEEYNIAYPDRTFPKRPSLNGRNP
jgi:hypothetical protein